MNRLSANHPRYVELVRLPIVASAGEEPCPDCGGIRRQRYRADGTKKGFYCAVCSRPGNRKRQARYRETHREVCRERWNRWAVRTGIEWSNAVLAGRLTP